MIPGNDGTDITRQETGQSGYRPIRCSICTHFILFHSIALEEPMDAPEPRLEWFLCKHCHEALLVEMQRSALQSPIRLRIAIGLVAAERSPYAYSMNTQTHEKREFDRQFAWFVWAIVLFGLLHVAIFAVLLAVPR